MKAVLFERFLLLSLETVYGTGLLTEWRSNFRNDYAGVANSCERIRARENRRARRLRHV